MSRKCAMCSDVRRQEMDDLLIRNVANSHLALDYGFTERQVGLHKKNHVTPFTQAANELAQQAIVDQVFEFRTEVHLPMMKKVCLMQNNLLNELDGTADIDKRISIIKEFRGWSIEEAKLIGAYVKDRENPADLEFARKKSLIEQWAREKGVDYQDELRLYLEKYSTGVTTEVTARLASELVQ